MVFAVPFFSIFNGVQVVGDFCVLAFMPRRCAGRGVLGCADSISLSASCFMIVAEILAGENEWTHMEKASKVGLLPLQVLAVCLQSVEDQCRVLYASEQRIAGNYLTVSSLT
jgi:hypothetical protein